MDAYVARPFGKAPFPGLVVFQEALGVNKQIRGVADRWAREGFLVIAPDLFHRIQPGYTSEVFDRGGEPSWVSPSRIRPV